MENTNQTIWRQGHSMILKRFSASRRSGQSEASLRLLGRAAVGLVLAVGFCLIICSQAAAASGYMYRRSITIAPANLGDDCGANLTDFPVLIDIRNANYLKKTGNDGHVANADGYDIAFTDADGNPLNHEVELYNPNSGTLVAWVKVPTLSASAETVINMVYGDVTVSAPTARPNDVWDANYQGVWHLNQSPTGNSGDDDILDSSANANHGQSRNMNPGNRADGRIGDALQFDGVRDYIRFGGDDLEITGNLTVEFWINPENISGDWDFYIGKTDSDDWDDGWGFYSNDDNRMHFYVKHYNNNDITAGLATDRFQHFVGVYDGSKILLYKNGASTSQSYSQGIPDSGTALTIGSSGLNDYNLDGRMDEVRISNTARDACWIETGYNNQSNPAGFFTIGEEEDSGAAVSTYTIDVAPTVNGIIASDSHGSSDLTGKTITVNKLDTPIFYLIPADGYEVSKVNIDRSAWEDYGNKTYQFDPVTEDTSIAVEFKKAKDETEEEEALPDYCSQNIVTEYTAGFKRDDLDLLNVEVEDDTKHIKLNTGNDAIDPNHIVIPWRQEVSVCFLYDGAGDKTCDFGWRLYSDGRITDGDKPNLIYENIMDENSDGVLDENEFEHENALDSCQVLGTFDAGTELVFYLTTDHANKAYRAGIDDLDEPIDFGKQIYWYTKTDWNQDVYTSYFLNGDDTDDHRACPTDTGYNSDLKDEFEKEYNLWEARENEGWCPDPTSGLMEPSGWMDNPAIERANTLFGLNFDNGDAASLDITWNKKYPAVMVGAPADQPNAWILGWENSVGGGDTDHNDLVFIIQRETGGTVQLNKSIPPEGTTENITGVTIGVWDRMPRDQCATEITYFVSANNGVSWVEVDHWDEVHKFKLQDDGQKVLLNEVNPDHWDPGSPEYTYRTRRVDFTEEDGATGHKLIWRAELRSSREGCEPKIIDMSLSLTLDQNRPIARATPTVLGNVLFSGSMETPAFDWTSAELRGHLKNTLVYHPLDTQHTFNTSDDSAAFGCGDYPGWADCPVIWDAGDKLNQMAPSERKIYIPNVVAHPISAEDLVTEDGDPVIGDGVTTTFSGRLAHYPVLATTVRISDTNETFSDKHTDVLEGSLNGSGKINRFTGHYEVTFSQAPISGQPITADYSYFTYPTDPTDTLREFKEGLVTKKQLGLDDSKVIPFGLIYDFTDHGTGTVDDADANWLINWTRGYADYDPTDYDPEHPDDNPKNPNDKSVKKEWILGAIDHSVPAVATPPASSPWFYGTAFPEDKQGSDQDRAGYKAFKEYWKERDTVVYAGARDGMLHAFDAGAFRWGDNPCTDETENRGYFQWTDTAGTSDCSQSDAFLDASTYCSATCQPDPSTIYGTGEELWAFIPANLLPRLKNNYLKEPDKAFVDASPALADVYTDGAWRTVLLAAEGNGGDTIFCLDVTDPRFPPKFMWEFADPDLFRSRSSPAVAQIGRILYQNTTKWVAFFVSGIISGDTVYPSIFVIDIADGSLVEKIELDAEADGAYGILSGQPTIVDSDGNGYVDRLYIGSDKGRLYKINIPDDPDSTKYGIGHCVVNTDYDDSDGNSPLVAKQYEPIYGSPTVVSSTGVDSTGQMIYDIRIFFGTGDSPYSDEDINFADTRYAFFAYRDTDAKGSCDSSQVELDWYLELEKGHRIYASAFAAADTIYFGTSTGDTEDPCDIYANSDDGIKANDGRLYAVDLYDPPKKIKDAEIVGFEGNVLAAPVVEDQHVYVQTINGEVASFGSGEYNNETRQGGIPEIDIHWWREVF